MDAKELEQILKQNNRKRGTPLWLNLIVLFLVLYGLATVVLPVALHHWQDYKTQSQQPQTVTQPWTQPWPIEIDTIDIEGLLNDAANAQNSITIREEPATIISTGEPPTVVESAPIDTAVIPTQEPVLNTTEEEKAFWADCAFKQGRGQRVSPKCPANAGELLREGR